MGYDGPRIPPTIGAAPPLVGLRPDHNPPDHSPRCRGLMPRCIKPPPPPPRGCDWYCIPVGRPPYWQHQERENRRWEYPLPHAAPSEPLPKAAPRSPAPQPPREPVRPARSEGFGLPRLGDIPRSAAKQANPPAATAPPRAQQQAQPATGRVIDVVA